MRKIINLTHHAASEIQIQEGVFEPSNKESVKEYGLIEFLPKFWQLKAKAQSLAFIAKESGADAAMIGGAPYLMGVLEKELKKVGVQPCYAFSIRESSEIQLDDGTVKKVAKFKHLGFYWVPMDEE